MKNYQLLKSVVLLCILAFAFSCNSKDDLSLDQSITQETLEVKSLSSMISSEQAVEVASAFFKAQSGLSCLRNGEETKSKATVDAIKDMSNNPLMYVINYPEGGWAIISATRNYYPVLAYSDENSFILSSNMGPVEVWLDETKEAIRLSETLNESTKTEISNVWNRFTNALESEQAGPKLRGYDPLDDAMTYRMGQLGSIYGYGGSGGYTITNLEGAQSIISNYSEWISLCNFANSYGSPPEYTIFVCRNSYPSKTVGPLLSTTWGQGFPFNYPCSEPAGCVPIAMAQIMKFHGHPSSFSWSKMRNEGLITQLLDSTPGLIKHIRNSLNMTQCSDTSTGIFETAYAFESVYQYHVSQANHATNQAKDYIFNNNRPIYMRGVSNADYGHAWVCDGAMDIGYTLSYFIEFINTYSYSYYSHPNIYNPSNPFETYQYSYLNFYMKWGDFGNEDGWFFDTIYNYYPNDRKNLYVTPK